jgi:hypothetical protein
MTWSIVMYEISQKQNYIFQTNELLENIGASSIIRRLTEEPEKLLNFDLPVPQHRLVGGGNAACLFDSVEEAVRFARILSGVTLKEYPGVALFLVTETLKQGELLYDLENQRGLLSRMRDRLALKKNRRQHASSQVSWGIHEICPDSGLPANRIVSGRPRAEELAVKAKIGKEARNEEFKEALLKKVDIPTLNGKPPEFFIHAPGAMAGREASGSEGRDYLAIVHIDGNGMGVKVAQFLSKAFRDNEDYIEHYGEFTRQIDHAYKQAFRRMLLHVMKDSDRWMEPIYGKSCQEQAHLIPVRPIVASGDDICFLAYAELGIELARLFLQYLQQEKIEIGREQLHFEACAGVALVRRKFPFWLGYERAEQLCSRAKARLKADASGWASSGKQSVEPSFDASLIDWEFQTDVDAEAKVANQGPFQNSDVLHLSNRPYYLQRQSDQQLHPASYRQWFLHSMETVQDKQDAPRSKWKALREVYCQGGKAVSLWQEQNQFHMGPNRLVITTEDTERPCAYYYDAIELMDLFIPLSEVNPR